MLTSLLTQHVNWVSWFVLLNCSRPFFTKHVSCQQSFLFHGSTFILQTKKKWHLSLLVRYVHDNERNNSSYWLRYKIHSTSRTRPKSRKRFWWVSKSRLFFFRFFFFADGVGVSDLYCFFPWPSSGVEFFRVHGYSLQYSKASRKNQY